jgi:FlaA1/EpsC-like NDP-sugar epimerase
LAGLVNLRLGQIQTVGDRSSADAAYRLAATYGSRSVAATAAWDLGRMLEQHGGDGPDIEEQYRRAAESGDPIVAPRAMISLGDLLWRSNRREFAEEWWKRAQSVGGDDIPARVARRFSGEWPYDTDKFKTPAALRPAPPLTDHAPPTPLGRVASGRASTFVPTAGGDRVRVIVVGAGTGGHYLQPGLKYDYEVVGYVDDDPKVTDVNGVPVLGPIDQLSAILQDDSTIELVIFAIPTASGATRLKVLEAVLRSRRRLLSLPSMFELLRGHPLVPQMRPIEVHETFGDHAWLVDRAAAGLVRGRRVAIVGAGSWIGEELARRVAHGQARHVLLIDKVSGPLMRITGELRELRDVVDCDARILDCAERHSLAEVFAKFRPEIVFHCAALNHSPADVLSLAHAARVNILGAETSAAVAEAHGATDFIMASADRASHRATHFDMTKAFAEQAVLALARGAVQREHTRLVVIGDSAEPFRVSVLRFPNVWAKEGPVLGRLIHQLSKGGPIRAAATAERCFIPAWEAAQAMLRLVDPAHDGGLFAYCGGDVVLIREIAERLIWINGLTAGRDVRIIDQPSEDTKVSVTVIGACEDQGECVSGDTYRVVQSDELFDRLYERVALFREAWDERNSVALDFALAPDVPADTPAVAAG